MLLVSLRLSAPLTWVTYVVFTFVFKPCVFDGRAVFMHVFPLGAPSLMCLCCVLYISRCICQALHEKITILVTHQLQYLKAASHILILKDVSNFWKAADLPCALLEEDLSTGCRCGHDSSFPGFMSSSQIRGLVEMSLLHSKPGSSYISDCCVAVTKL